MREGDSSHGQDDSQQLGRYHLITTLGQGGMGTIHLAVMPGLGEFQKLLVVKELRRDLACNAAFVRMFLREAELAARLSHANVVQTLEAGQVGDRYFLSMEFLDGQPFSELLRRAHQKPEATLPLRLQVICDALAGLHYAHELRDYGGHSLEIVHRDVSPQNVFITYDGTVKVVDFGIAKAAGADATAATLFKGKLAYAAPEQICGAPVDARTDVFAAGVMLWEAIALKRFARERTDSDAIESRLTGTEPRISEVVSNVDPELARICDCALSRDPDDRYPSAEAFRLALSSYLATLGPRQEAATIGQLLATKFASERSAMHRLIHRRVTGDESATTTIRPVRVARAPAEDESTAVADLSELAAVARRSDRPPSAMPPVAPRRAKALWAVGAAVCVAALALAYASSQSAVADGVEATGGDGQQTSSLSLRGAEGQVTGDDPTGTSIQGEAAATGSRIESAAAGEGRAPFDEADAERSGNEKAGARAARRRSQRRAPRPTAAKGRSSGPSGEAEGADRMDIQEDPAAAPSNTSPTPVSAHPAMGKDLQAAPKKQRRELDVENPFR